MTEKVRLDVALFERGFVDSREKGKALIMAGLVYVNGQKETKAGTSVKADACIELRGEKMPYVSRGGYKLKKALDERKDQSYFLWSLKKEALSQIILEILYKDCVQSNCFILFSSLFFILY